MPVTVYINGQATNSNQQHGDSRKRSECSGKNLNRNILVDDELKQALRTCRLQGRCLYTRVIVVESAQKLLGWDDLIEIAIRIIKFSIRQRR